MPPCACCIARAHLASNALGYVVDGRVSVAPSSLGNFPVARALHGFGQAVGSAANYQEPSSTDELAGLLEKAVRDGRSVGLSGAGRSYGDAALNENGVVIGCTLQQR